MDPVLLRRTLELEGVPLMLTKTLNQLEVVYPTQMLILAISPTTILNVT